MARQDGCGLRFGAGCELNLHFSEVFRRSFGAPCPFNLTVCANMSSSLSSSSRRMSLQVISGNTSFGASSRPSEKKKKNGQGRRKGRRVSMMPRVNARSGSRSSVGRTSQGRQSLGRQSVGRQSVGRQSVGRQSAGRQSMGR